MVLRCIFSGFEIFKFLYKLVFTVDIFVSEGGVKVVCIAHINIQWMFVESCVVLYMWVP